MSKHQTYTATQALRDILTNALPVAIGSIDPRNALHIAHELNNALSEIRTLAAAALGDAAPDISAMTHIGTRHELMDGVINEDSFYRTSDDRLIHTLKSGGDTLTYEREWREAPTWLASH